MGVKIHFVGLGADQAPRTEFDYSFVKKHREYAVLLNNVYITVK